MKKIGRILSFPFQYAKAWTVTTCIVLVLMTVVNSVILTVPLIRNTMNTVFGEERRVLVSGDPSQAVYYELSKGINSKEDALAQANALNERLCEEGFVLLKNEGALPLAENARVCVFGMNSVDPVYGGSGSSAKDNSQGIDIYKSLDNAGIAYNADLRAFYEAKLKSGKGRTSKLNFDTGVLEGLETGELAMSEYDKPVSAYADGYADAALVVISRIGGEGYDLPVTMKGVAGADPTNHYLELDNYEKALIAALTAEDSGFKKVILILNCATSFELGFLNDGTYSDALCGALWVGTTGGTGMNALGKILSGEVNPSGRLVDTYAADFTATPSFQNFANNAAPNGNRYLVDGALQNAYFVDYEEGIYVGYRYYETRGAEDEDWYQENVVFPFGYGLSYTTFDWKVTPSIKDGASVQDGDTLTFTVDVTNTGDMAGKDVVELYYTAPYTIGGIEKSHVVLGAFAKTEIIPAGETRSVTLTLNVSDMKSYDYSDANSNGHKGYELESGDYVIRIARNAHTYEENFTYKLSETVNYTTDTENTGAAVENRFDSVSNHITTYLSRSDWSGTFPTTPTEEDRTVSQELIDSMSVGAYIGEGTKQDRDKPWYSSRRPRPKRVELSYNETEVKLYDMVGKSYEDPLWDQLLNQLTDDQMRYLVGTGNFNTAAIENIDKPKTIEPDGPAGYTQFMSGVDSTAVVYDTAFYCSECIVGATWNVELAEAFGSAVGDESLIGNERGDGRTYSGWYAPAANTHRSPFGGRNWEYFSEDGFLAGKIAAGIVKGANSKGVYTYMKHFVVNDQETDRDTNGLTTWVNEQALREIYMRPFEIAVKEGNCHAIMSSFNRIGTVWAGGCYELLTEILRNEWGFCGAVITDYANAYMNPDQMIRAGGDLCLFQDQQPSARGTASHFTALRKAVKNILYTVVNSNAMNGMGAGIVYRYAMPYWMIVLFSFDAVLAAAFAAWGFHAFKKGKKKAASKS